MHGVATLFNYWVVLFASSQYLSTHFYAWPSISLDHEKCSRQVSLHLVGSPKLQQGFWIRTCSCNFLQQLCLFNILFECNQKMVKGWCWFSLINVFHEFFFQVGLMFCFLPSNFTSSSYTDKNSRLARLTKKHSQFKSVPNRVPIELSQIAVSIIVLPKDGRTDSVQEELHNYFTITSQLLHNYFTITSQLLHNYFTITSQLLHNYFTITSQLLRNYFAITSQLLRNYFTITSQLLHNYFTITSQLLHNYFTNTSQLLHNYFTITSQLLHNYFTITSQLLRNYFTITSQLLHNYFTITSQLLHKYFTITSQLLHNHFTITSQSLHNHFAITSQSLRNHFAITSQSLRNHFTITSQLHHNYITITSQLHQRGNLRTYFATRTEFFSHLYIDAQNHSVYLP